MGSAMRSIGWALVFLGLATTISAQSPGEAKTAMETTPAAVTLDDLQGHTIHLTVSFATRFRLHGGKNDGEYTGGRTNQTEVKIGPDANIRWVTHVTGWVDTANGKNAKQMTREGKGMINVPSKTTDGTVNNLWALEGSLLTWLGVVETGAFTVKISLLKGASGLKCSATASLAREQGAGNNKDRSAGGGKVETLSARPSGSSCRIS
jgi:hypothetical protein